MYTLKGVFPEPKKPHKKNFIKDNVKQLKHMQIKAPTEPTMLLKSGRDSRLSAAEPLQSVQSTTSNKIGKPAFQIATTSSGISRGKKPSPDIKFKKGDMAEFLRRKELRQLKIKPKAFEEVSPSESESAGRLRDVACQTVESNLPPKTADGTKLTVLYPKEDGGSKLRASGDSSRNKDPSPSRMQNAQKGGDDIVDQEQKRKAKAMEKEKDPYLPTGYQRGVLPRYLRERREETKVAENVQDEDCPPGHVTLPDHERKETLRMLRNSFAELVSELNKMPVRTDTLRMRSRKMELEKQLAKLEEGIKVFSRPKVFVRIGE